MGLRPTQGDEKRRQSGSCSHASADVPFVIPSGAEGSAVQFSDPTNLSSRPERTRISCHAAPDKAACAPFRRERRINFANATKFDRKSGGAQWRDLRLDLSCECDLRQQASLLRGHPERISARG
jgi:hypothetical protein